MYALFAWPRDEDHKLIPPEPEAPDIVLDKKGRFFAEWRERGLREFEVERAWKKTLEGIEEHKRAFQEEQKRMLAEIMGNGKR